MIDSSECSPISTRREKAWVLECWWRVDAIAAELPEQVVYERFKAQVIEQKPRPKRRLCFLLMAK